MSNERPILDRDIAEAVDWLYRVTSRPVNRITLTAAALRMGVVKSTLSRTLTLAKIGQMPRMEAARKIVTAHRGWMEHEAEYWSPQKRKA